MARSAVEFEFIGVPIYQGRAIKIDINILLHVMMDVNDDTLFLLNNLIDKVLSSLTNDCSIVQISRILERYKFLEEGQYILCRSLLIALDRSTRMLKLCTPKK